MAACVYFPICCATGYWIFFLMILHKRLENVILTIMKQSKPPMYRVVKMSGMDFWGDWLRGFLSGPLQVVVVIDYM